MIGPAAAPMPRAFAPICPSTVSGRNSPRMSLVASAFPVISTNRDRIEGGMAPSMTHRFNVDYCTACDTGDGKRICCLFQPRLYKPLQM